MHISDNGINLIKKFEGCVLHTYSDAVGVLTIGYGHTEGVKMGTTITQAQAEEMLKTDLANKYESKVSKYDSTYHWNQNEFDALVSFAYNIGSIDDLTAKGTRSKQVIADKILLYNKAGGQVLSGLTTRRKKERELYLTACMGQDDVTPKYEIGWNKDESGWWYADTESSYYKSCWQIVNGHKYYFNPDGYAVKDWQEIGGKWYYFEPREGHDLECALYKSDDNGVQEPAGFETVGE